jgi:hypothetical protein
MEKTLMQINLKKLLSKAKLQKQLKKKNSSSSGLGRDG